MISRRIQWFGLAVAVVGWYALPAAADEGMPSRAKLQAMGLADAQIVSDVQALTVRGLGFGGKGGAPTDLVASAGKYRGKGGKHDNGQYDGPVVGEGHNGPAPVKHRYGGKHGHGGGITIVR